MKQIDAAIAVKILVASAPSGTADPLRKAMRFIEEAARLGRVQVRAFRGHATDGRETVPAVEVADLSIDFMARASKVDHDLGEADLVTARVGYPLRRGYPRRRTQYGVAQRSLFAAVRSKAPKWISWRGSKAARLRKFPRPARRPARSVGSAPVQRRTRYCGSSVRFGWTYTSSLADDRIVQRVLDRLKGEEDLPDRAHSSCRGAEGVRRARHEGI